MSNDDAWSGAGKIPPMVYVPPPDADAPTGRGGIIGLFVLLLTIIFLIVAGVFALQNWFYSKNLLNPANWAELDPDTGIYGLLKEQEKISRDTLDAPNIERYRTDLVAQNRFLCENIRRTPAAPALPDLLREVEAGRRSYDTACQNQGRSARCTTVSQPGPVTITADQRAKICAQYPNPQAASRKP